MTGSLSFGPQSDEVGEGLVPFRKVLLMCKFSEGDKPLPYDVFPEEASFDQPPPLRSFPWCLPSTRMIGGGTGLREPSP